MKIEAAISRADTPNPIITPVNLDAPQRDEMLVRIVATGICQTDLHAHAGMLTPLPIVLGHEGAGIVEAVGESVTQFQPGDHVVLSGNSCGHCPGCDSNLPSYCDTSMRRVFGGSRMDGSTCLSCGDESVHSHFFGQSSFATHAIVPERTAVKVDKSAPIEKLGPLGCGIITGAGAIIETLRVGTSDIVAIFGVGSVGLSAVMAAKLVDARKIIVVDSNPSRLELAIELGATDAFRADEQDLAAKIRATTGRGVECTFNTTNVPAVYDVALDCLAMRGAAAFVAAPRGDWSPNMRAMLSGGRTLRGVLGGDASPTSFIPMLIDHWKEGRFPFERLLTFYPFAEIDRAFADIRAGRVIKPVLLMSENER